MYSTHGLNLLNGCLCKRGIREFFTSLGSDRFYMINVLENLWWSVTLNVLGLLDICILHMFKTKLSEPEFELTWIVVSHQTS